MMSKIGRGFGMKEMTEKFDLVLPSTKESHVGREPFL